VGLWKVWYVYRVKPHAQQVIVDVLSCAPLQVAMPHMAYRAGENAVE
jgi:hypothetical protein